MLDLTRIRLDKRLAIISAIGALSLISLRTVYLLTAPATVRAGGQHDESIAARQQYSEHIGRTYSEPFGKGQHFLPSNLQTDTGQFIDPNSFPTAQYCGHCHQESHQQWRESAHSNSNRAPWYLRNVQLLTHEKGVEYTRHCEGCHDPVALVSGTLTPGQNQRRPFDEDGVTCSVCHAIQKVDTRGTGSYVLGVPAVLVNEDGTPITRQVSDGEILAHLDRHSAAVMKPFYKTSEFCSACHKAALPRQLNGYKWQRAISLYDEWQSSSFAKESPLPFYQKAEVSTCQTCHMQRETLALADSGAKHNQLASHRWLGANTVIPAYYHYNEQLKRTIQFLQNDVFHVDFFALEAGRERSQDRSAQTSDKIVAPLGSVPATVDAGEILTADIVIQNKGEAHSHVPEQRDMYQSWVDFTLKDRKGKVLKESGFIMPSSGLLDPQAHSFTNRLINVNGGLNAEHQVWDSRVVAYNNTIQSGRSQLVRYSFHMPPAAVGPITLTATVQYRRFNQHFIDFGMNMPENKHYKQTVVSMASSSIILAVGKNQPVSPSPPASGDWRRWNNYGIALLDGQQYDAAIDAFTQVIRIRPDYVEGYTNRAIAEIQWQRFDDAGADLEHSLDVLPGNARALYYRAIVARAEGHLASAVADLQAVLRAYPRSRDAHRELGFALYQQHRYAAASSEYEAVQSIDPDDLAAHYNLSILYSRLGLKDKASGEAATFADEKDDPNAAPYALAYLRKHAELANETTAWHTHDLDNPIEKVPTALPKAFSGTQQ